MSGEKFQPKIGVSASDAHAAAEARRNEQIDAANAEKAKKEKLNADIRQYFADLGINADKTKTISRMVDGKETNIVFGHDKNGKKVYIDANTGKEVVVTETRGKNEFTTKDKLENELMNRFGMSSKDFAEKKIIAEFKHGKIVLTDVERGNRLPEAFLTQLEDKHRADLAAKRQPTPKELAYQAKAEEQKAANEVAKNSAPAQSTITEEEFFKKMQAFAPQLNGVAPEADKTAELKDLAKADKTPQSQTVRSTISEDIGAWNESLLAANSVPSEKPAAPETDKTINLAEADKTPQSQTVRSTTSEDIGAWNESLLAANSAPSEKPAAPEIDKTINLANADPSDPRAIQEWISSYANKVSDDLAAAPKKLEGAPKTESKSKTQKKTYTKKPSNLSGNKAVVSQTDKPKVEQKKNEPKLLTMAGISNMGANIAKLLSKEPVDPKNMTAALSLLSQINDKQMLRFLKLGYIQNGKKMDLISKLSNYKGTESTKYSIPRQEAVKRILTVVANNLPKTQTAQKEAVRTMLKEVSGNNWARHAASADYVLKDVLGGIVFKNA